MPQRLGAGVADARVLVLLRDDLLGALGLDARQLELLAQDLGELLERDLDLEQVIARALAGLALARLLLAFAAERVADLAVALPDAALLLVAVLKCGMSICGIGIATVSLPFFAIISPCEMYLRRFCLILPRMIWRNRP